MLIVQEVDSIDPILLPVLRGDFINQGIYFTIHKTIVLESI
jgi:hypothetical protein